MWARVGRWRWAALIVVLLLAGLTWAFWPAGAPVDTAKVTRGPMAVGVTDDGVTRAKEFYIVTAPVTGYLARIELEPGDPVARGQLITRMTGSPSTPLDPRSREELQGALAAAEAAAAGTRATLAQSRRDLARAEELSQRGFLPRAQLEAARTRVTSGEATLAQALAEATRARAALAQPHGPGGGAPVPVRAPASGQVLSVLRESEGVISEGTELMAIGDPHAIELVVDLLSREAVRVKPGDRVEITEWGGADPLVGTVERIEPFGRLRVSALGIEEQRVNVIVGFTGAAAQQAARLGHGYQVDATIIRWRSDDVLRVPIGALFRGGDGNWRVFVAAGGRARERNVRLGHMDDEFGEVLGGLAVADEVIINPASSLRPGARVRAR